MFSSLSISLFRDSFISSLSNSREMVVVHPDADFLNDIAGKLREVLQFFVLIESSRCHYG